MVTPHEHTEPTAPTVVESYRDFEPPLNFRSIVETLLSHVPPKYLVGLKSVILTNRAGLTRDKRRQKVWSRHRKIRLADAAGSYSRATNSSHATVWLYVDNIVAAEASWWKRVPVFCYLIPAHVLYHEIGHHIHTVHRPIHEEREDVADEWRSKLSGLFYRRHYWYLMPALYPLSLLVGLAKPAIKISQRWIRNFSGENM
jgi:hypothetical protein